jgi:hypothetical protein
LHARLRQVQERLNTGPDGNLVSGSISRETEHRFGLPGSARFVHLFNGIHVAVDIGYII